MFLQVSRHTTRLVCVIMFLLIQFDVCTPLMDAIGCQIEMAENAMTEDVEEETSDEVYYRSGKTQQTKAQCVLMNVFDFIRDISIPSVSVQSNDPVPKVLGKVIQQYVIFCVYRI